MTELWWLLWVGKWKPRMVALELLLADFYAPCPLASVSPNGTYQQFPASFHISLIPSPRTKRALLKLLCRPPLPDSSSEFFCTPLSHKISADFKPWSEDRTGKRFRSQRRHISSILTVFKLLLPLSHSLHNFLLWTLSISYWARH